MTLNGEMALILRYFTEFGSFRGELRKIGWQSHITMDKTKISLNRDKPNNCFTTTSYTNTVK